MITTLTGKNEYELRQTLREVMNKWRKLNSDAPIEIYEAEDIDNIASFINDAQTVSLFSAKRMVIVRHTSDNKDLLALIEKYGSNIPDDISLVIYDPSLDLRTKTAKWLKQNSDWRELKPLDRFQLSKWLKLEVSSRKIDVTAGAQDLLLERTGGDQLRLSQELDKLALKKTKIDEAQIELTVARNLDDNIFDLLDAICHQRRQRAAQLMTDFKTSKIDPHYIFNMLVWQFNVVALSLSSDKSADTIAQSADMKPGAIARAKSLRSYLPPKRLGELLELMAEIDEQIRVGDAWAQLDRLLF